MTTIDLTEMTGAYLIAALWTATEGDDVGTPLDERFDVGDFTKCAQAVALTECARFLVDIEAKGLDISDIDDAQLGHDLLLTRDGHGVGFWDRDLGKLGDDLTAICASYPPSHVQPLDDDTLDLFHM